MNTFTPEMLVRAVAAHPRASLQDALLLLVLMLAALLLALQYDLFYFIEQLSRAQRKISLAEAIFLTVLLTACIFTFLLRRLSDQRRDIAFKAAAQAELRELTALALQDPLTGLFNRRALLSALTAAVTELPTDRTQNALFLIDLNGFKRVNDLHGHSVGDQVLQVVTGRFQAAARPSDLVARIGGDEFAVLSYNVDRETAQQIGLRFLESLTGKIRAGGHLHEVSMSVGVALIPDDGATAEEVLHHADLAMYRAKELGCPLMFYERSMAAKKRIA